MKILALVEDLRINKTSAGICNSRILKALLDGNHTITCLYDYSTTKNFEWLENDRIKLKSIKRLKEKKIVSFLNKIPKISGISTYVTGFQFSELRKIKSWKVSILEELKNKHDLILVLGAGNSNMNFFAIEKIKTKIPYIVNYHDPYPIQQYPKPYAKPMDYLGRLKVKKSEKVINKSYKVSFPSLKLYEWMLKYHASLKDKSFVLPHVFAELSNLPVLESDTLLKLNEENLNILHVGSLLGPRNPKFLIKVFNEFCNENEDRKKHMFLNIVGSVVSENKNFEKGINLDNINVIKKRISYNKSLELLHQSNVNLILQANSNDSPFMPGKLADYITAKKPIFALSNKNSETSRILGLNYELITDLNNEKGIYDILSVIWKKWKDNKMDDLLINSKSLTNYVSVENFNTIFIKQTKDLNA